MASLLKRGGTYYAQQYIGRRIKRVSLRTDSLQLAKEKLRQIESAVLRGEPSPLPTRTPLPDLLTAYVEHIRVRKTAKSAQTDVYYLREVFGPICPAVTITSRRVTPATRRRALLPGTPRRSAAPTIQVADAEQITTAAIADFIAAQVRTRGLAPKTANRYREILCRLFNWAMNDGRIRMPGNANPAAKVQRYKERAPTIRYLTLVQIDEQLHVLRFNPKLQTIVAVYIYAGLRREEALWLTTEDVDLRRGLIRVQAKTIGGAFWQPKTGVNRAVPISWSLREQLARYIVPASGHGWYFPSPLGLRWDVDNFSADLRAENAAAKLAWACLDYRHTFGSQLAQKGVSLFKIATLLGNSPEICRRHYASLAVDTMKCDVDFSVGLARSVHAELVCPPKLFK